jgi:PAS domain S-box-containing protein
MLVADFQARIVAVNPAAATLSGWDEAELSGANFLELIHPEDLEKTLAEMARLARGEVTQRFEIRVLRKDRGWLWSSWTAAPAEGLIYAVGRDVTREKLAATELEQAQAALRQAQKMEAVGQLTGGIAHDFNNLLTGVLGSLDLLERRVRQGRIGEIDRYLDAASSCARRAAALTQRLLAFSRRQPLDPRPVDVNALVRSMDELLRRTLGEKIALSFVCAEGLWPTRCDAHQLESAVLNLAINARDAMPDGGELVVETANVRFDKLSPAPDPELTCGDYVRLSVRDAGAGIPADILHRVVEPFFTTKPIGQGTGLGLSMIYGFARQSDGHLHIASEPGRGTTVTLWLPRHSEAVDSEDDTGRPDLNEAPVARDKVVLVVEDEEAVREVVVEVLTELGCTVLEAVDGPAGLQALQTDRRIDLLVTDVGLPGLNGRQLADAGRALRPALRVLFMTGYAATATAGGFLEPGMEMVTKPFEIEALSARIREMLGVEI